MTETRERKKESIRVKFMKNYSEKETVAQRERRGAATLTNDTVLGTVLDGNLNLSSPCNNQGEESCHLRTAI